MDLFQIFSGVLLCREIFAVDINSWTIGISRREKKGKAKEMDWYPGRGGEGGGEDAETIQQLGGAVAAKRGMDLDRPFIYMGSAWYFRGVSSRIIGEGKKSSLFVKN